MHSSSPHRQLSAMDEVQKCSMAPKMMRKKMRPATSETEKLYFMKISAAWIMREQRLSKIQLGWAADYSLRYQGRTSSTRLAMAHRRGTRDRTTANMTTPDCVSGARPSGVEEPTISQAISIDIDYQSHLILSHPPPTTHFTYRSYSTSGDGWTALQESELGEYGLILALHLNRIHSNMSKAVIDSQDEDSFNFNLWRQHRSKTQPLPIDQPTKRTAATLEGKKTVKYSQDPIMEHLLSSIIRQSDKFPDQPPSLPYNDEVQEFKPNLINGVVSNAHLCSSEEKQVLGLSEEGNTIQFQINDRYTVVVIGRLGYLPLQGANVQLYLPHQLSYYLNSKTRQSIPQPDPSLWLQLQHKIYIKIRRKLLTKKQLSILDYPYFVIDPSNLLYPTYLCSWIDCKRRISLSNYVTGDKTVNQHTVYGSTCHRLLQWFSQQKLTTQQYDQQPLRWIKQLYDSMLYDMFLIRKSFEDFLATCRGRLNNITRFYQTHIVNSTPLAVEPYNKLTLKLEKVVESEIMIRSSAFGLKGKIDLLLYGQLIDGKNGTQKGVYVSMELKTGRRVSDSHKRQTDIYNILVKEKYKKPVMGLLYYSDSDIKFFRYEDPLSAYEIVIAHRNHIAQNILQLTSKTATPLLPPFPPTFSQCNYCEVSSICQLSYRSIQNTPGTVDLSSLPSKQHESIRSELNSFKKNEVEYVSRWFRMIHMQEQEQEQVSQSQARINLLKFQLKSKQLLPLLEEKQKRVRLNIERRCANQDELTTFDEFYRPSFKVRCIMSAIQLLEGCKVVQTSVEACNLLFKMVIEMNNQHIQFNESKTGFLLEHNIDCNLEIQTFSNYMFANLRSAVLELVKSDGFLKTLVVGQEEEKLRIEEEEGKEGKEEEGKEGSVGEGREENVQYLVDLNSDQTEAFRSATSNSRLCLIEGMPGTGKTELILRLIHYFHNHSLKILVTTYTNRSLDNILERLIDSKRIDPQFLIRQGSQYAVSSALKAHSAQTDSFTSIDDYIKYFGSKRVWFVTLSSLHIHHLPDKFDVVIVDEASQSLQPNCVSALMRGEKYVVIGDYHQLQPLVRSKQALAQGMGVSLFERLCQKMPNCKVSLRKQYRMNEKIMALSNALVYKGELQLANKQVKNKQLKLNPLWQRAVPPSFLPVIEPTQPIVFINYDPILHSITRKYAQKQREIRKVIETELPAFILKLFCQAGLPPVSLGVIAALNVSVNRMKDLVRKWKYSEDMVLTIDKSQGIDKEVVVLLIEKANEELVQNPRRLNVALTRAKSKLVVVGSQDHLSTMKLWKGSLGGMLREYQMELTKAMISDMIGNFAEHKDNSH